MTRPLFTRVVVRFLVLFLAPILIVSSSTAAHAVVKNGPGVVFAFKDDSSIIPGNWLDCTATANWKRIDSANPTIRVTGGLCEDGWAASPTLEGGQDEALFAAACADTGEVFEFRTSVMDFTNETGLPTFELRYLQDATGTIPAGCTVSAINWKIFDEGTGRDGLWEGSTTVNLGSPPAAVTPVDDSVPADAACTKFKLTGRPTVKVTPVPGSSYQMTYTVTMKMDWLAGTSITVNPIFNRNGANSYGDNSYSFGPPNKAVTSGAYSWIDQRQWGGADRVAGLQVWVGGFPSGDTYDNRLPQTVAGGDLGVTVPSKCRFYFGEKIAQTPADTTDEPHAPLGDGAPVPVDDPDPSPTNPAPVGDTEGGCEGFSFTDPTSWAGAGICVLVKAVNALIDAVGGVLGLLGDVLAAIGDLVAAIVDGITGALSSLFIPSDGFMDERQSALSAEVQESRLGDWDSGFNDGLRGALPSGGAAAGPEAMESPTFSREGGADFTAMEAESASCMGPHVSWDGFEQLGMPVDWHPVAACDGTAATLAQWSRLLLTGLIILTTLGKCIQMIAVAVGASRQIDALRFDWSEDVRVHR